jgi:hypothetical protein
VQQNNGNKHNKLMTPRNLDIFCNISARLVGWHADEATAAAAAATAAARPVMEPRGTTCKEARQGSRKHSSSHHMVDNFTHAATDR